jgi:hypothetical protein
MRTLKIVEPAIHNVKAQILPVVVVSVRIWRPTPRIAIPVEWFVMEPIHYVVVEFVSTVQSIPLIVVHATLPVMQTVQLAVSEFAPIQLVIPIIVVDVVMPLFVWLRDPPLIVVNRHAPTN